MKMKDIMKLTVAGVALPAIALSMPALADGDEGDGAPHIAIVDDAGVLEIEFEVEFGLDETTDPPTINLLVPNFVAEFAGYPTIPVNDTPIPNDDLGFVSELEGGGEGGAISGDIVIRMLSKDDNFRAVFGSEEIFTDSDPDFVLGSAFDTHPIWILNNLEGDTTPASASFEVLDISGGGEESVGLFDVTLNVPEPTSGLLLFAGAGLLAARRRR